MPYQPDLAAALQQARQEAYEQGRFYREQPSATARSMSEEDYVAWDMAGARESFIEAFGDDGGDLDDTFSRQAWHAAQVEVTDPDSLLMSQPFAGTHSIIDMIGIAPEPTAHHVAPVPDEDLDAIFGGRRPSAAAVAQAIEDRTLTGQERWYGRYVIAYAADAPEVVFFVGYSGD